MVGAISRLQNTRKINNKIEKISDEKTGRFSGKKKCKILVKMVQFCVENHLEMLESHRKSVGK